MTPHLPPAEIYQIDPDHRVARARNAGLADAVEQVVDFLNDLSNADLDEIAADGGVTVGMVLQQQAKWTATKLQRAAPAKDAEIEALRERVRGLTPAAQIIVGLFDAQTPEQKKARPAAIDKALREFRALLADGGEK